MSPIIPNRLVAGQTPFFKNFGSYAVDDNLEIVETVAGMISYSLIPHTPATIIDHNVGAENNYVLRLSVKNLTTNANLDILIETVDDYFTVDNSNFTLRPEETRDIVISMNNGYVNRPNIFDFASSIKLIVSNLSTNTIITRRVDVEPLQVNSLPNLITIE